MTGSVTGVILAGGLNTRFEGRDKAFVQVGGMRLIDRIYAVFSDLFNEIILVTNQPQKFLDWDLTVVSDLFDVRSSLTGIHAGLFYATHPHAFFAACDTPFLKRDLVSCILTYLDGRMDAFIPETGAGLEPLCAAYAKKSLPVIESRLGRNLLKVSLVFRNDRIKRIPEKVLRRHDPELISFFNINTQADLARAQSLDSSR